MPWDTNDYPSSWKNFDSVLRKKAIEMANAMINEGYDEDQAIPIATNQAKEWFDNASANERDEMAKKTDVQLRKTDDDRNSRPELLDHAIHVLPDDGWVVKTADAKRAANRYETKEEAIERGKEIAKNKETQLVIHKQSGEIQTVRNYEA
ncbi:uncharacterized protein YdaT [Natronobacillus azotifigens]|uniref:DUF2188 domain-containing protein n=1 Tax=Natronobacillus azotifigens TaxID=472978 RepID=A0A9J6RG50_9BACI|nr:DUF2188 domain-containing protein [Natronobacillus azotifigens]MCZ0704381.1 DUF2188 domain-containing protein [Natronobacillus azotifigens]